MMEGTAKPWTDVRIEPIARTTGANAPSFSQVYTNGSGSRGVYLYKFDNAAGGSEKEIFFTLQMPHEWDGGEIHMHVHWVALNTETSKAVRWGLEYTWAEPGASFGNTTILYKSALEGGSADVTANKHSITAWAAIPPSSTQDDLSTILIGRVFRDSNHADDTYTSDAYLLYIDAHFQLNSLGSTDEYTK
jgi:hypothetical protein